MNNNSTLVANPNRTQIRTEADLRRSAPPANPEPASNPDHAGNVPAQDAA
ncbi:hypothetical protein Q5425_33275 [Amycolatopsis sp. A133]|nr:hypothetical protein [Amycolatopsis sp. A133]MDQ7808631.1 hypothetical protein [Amycolatopsis sp. A133]